MKLCMCYQRSTRPWMVLIFILRLSARTLSGLFKKAHNPPIRLHPPSGVDGIWPLFFLNFTSFIPTHWYLFALSSQTFPVWTVSWGLRSVIEGLILSAPFLEGFWVCRQFFWSFPHELDYFPPPIFMGFYALVTRSLTVWLLVWRRLCGVLLVHQFPVMTGDPMLLSRTSLQRLMTDKGLMGSLPLGSEERRVVLGFAA